MKPILIITQTSLDESALINYLTTHYEGPWVISDYSSKSDFKEDLSNLSIDYAVPTNIYLGDLDKLSLSFQQSTLKFLEEPPRNLKIFLTKSTQYQLLPTIQSRVELISLTQSQAGLMLNPEQLARVKKYFPAPQEAINQLITSKMEVEQFGTLADIEREDILFYLWQLEVYLNATYLNDNNPRISKRIQDVLLAKQNIMDNLQKKIGLMPLLFV
jgi:hypothetical protein